jgi:hypothetical protein
MFVVSSDGPIIEIKKMTLTYLVLEHPWKNLCTHLLFQRLFIPLFKCEHIRINFQMLTSLPNKPLGFLGLELKHNESLVLLVY